MDNQLSKEKYKELYAEKWPIKEMGRFTEILMEELGVDRDTAERLDFLTSKGDWFRMESLAEVFEWRLDSARTALAEMQEEERERGNQKPPESNSEITL